MNPFMLGPLALTLLTPVPQPPTAVWQVTPRPEIIRRLEPPPAVWPLTPRPEIVRGFEPPPKPWLPGHRGLDLRGTPGQQVRSATPGKVTYAGPLAGRGVIVITNGPLRTTYEPVIPTIRPGTTVIPGTPLGHLSAAASHCAPTPCLHWGLLNATTYLNPLALLPHHPIRLLPTSELTPGNTQRQLPDNHSRAAPQTSVNPPRNHLTSGVLVGVAAAATLIGSLLIRRH